MIKVMFLVKSKPGVPREEFCRHYEEVHVPLALKCFPTFKRYVRNYVITTPDAEEPGFDCITEIWFDNMEDCQETVDLWGSEAGQAIREDEDTFMDRDKTVSFLVEERATK